MDLKNIIKCIYFHYQQDLDKIAEANELFDAVLTGSVNQDKRITTKKAHFMKAPSEEDGKSVDEYTQKGGSSLKKLAVYIGNFPWVSTRIEAELSHLGKWLDLV